MSQFPHQKSRHDVIRYLLGLSCGEGNGTPLRYSCLENPMDRGAWWAAVHGVAKSQTRLSNFTFTFHFHALEKEMATHSSVLAWRIPGTGEPGGAAIYVVTQSWTRLKRLSNSSSRIIVRIKWINVSRIQLLTISITVYQHCLSSPSPYQERKNFPLPF